MAHFAVPGLLFALAFVLTTWGLRMTLPRGDGDLLTGKLAAFEKQDAADPFNVVFLGSSRIYHGVRPEVFDARMKERGHSVRSFNLAVTGQKIDGAFSALRSLTAQEPQGVRYVFVDPERISLMLSDLRRSMRGLIPLHDFGSSELLLDYVWNSDLKFWDKYDRSVEIVQACAYDTVNVGRGLGWLDDLLGRSPTTEDMAFRIGPRADGWRSKDDRPKAKSAEAHRKFLAAPGAWRAAVNRLVRTEPDSEPLHESAKPLITRIAELARENGAEPLFFTSPSNAYHGQLLQAHEQGVVQTLFRFNDPEAYPELYEADARWEAVHLSEEGANRFSRILADRFADWLDAKGEQEQ